MSRASGRAGDDAPTGPEAQLDAAAIDAQFERIASSAAAYAVLMAAIHGPGERFKTTFRDALTRELEKLRPALIAGAQEQRRRSALKRARAPTASEIEFITEHIRLSPRNARYQALIRALGRKPVDRFATVRDSVQRRLLALQTDLRDLLPEDPRCEEMQRQIDELRPVFDVAARPTARLIELSARVHEHLTTRARDERGGSEWDQDNQDYPDCPDDPHG